MKKQKQKDRPNQTDSKNTLQTPLVKQNRS